MLYFVYMSIFWSLFPHLSYGEVNTTKSLLLSSLICIEVCGSFTRHAYYKVGNPESNELDLLHFLLIIVSLL